MRLVLLLAGILACAGATHAAPEGVTLLPSGASTIHLLVESPEPALRAREADPSQTLVELPGHESLGPPGTPALPVRMLLVALPPTGNVRLQVSAYDRASREGVDVAPMPQIDGSVVRLPEAYEAAGPVAPERARLVGVSWMRNQRVAHIEIHPVDLEPAARRLSWYRRIDLTLELDEVVETTRPAEPDDPFERVYRATLVNYEQGRAWRRPAAETLAPSLAPGPGLARAQAVPDTSLFAGRPWVKLEIPHTGFYKVELSQLRNSGLFGGSAAVRLDSLRLFTWPGYPILPERTYCDSCGYREVAIQFVENAAGQPGVFDLNDEYFYFFALGPSDWADLYDPSYGDSVFLDNPYETRNFYFLTIDTPESPLPGPPLRLATAPGTVTGGGTVPQTFAGRVHYERDFEYFGNASPLGETPFRPDLFWERWYWKSIDIGTVFTPSDPELDAPGADTAQPYRIRARVWGLTSGQTCSGRVFPLGHQLDTEVNGAALNRISWSSDYARIVDTVLTGLRRSGNQVSFSTPSRTGTGCSQPFDRIGIAWVQFFYRRAFETLGDSLIFDSEPGGGFWLYRIDSLRSATPPRLFDVTDPLAPLEIVGFLYEEVVPGRWRLSFERTEAGRHRYRVVPPAGIVRLPNLAVRDAAVPSLANLNLRSPLQGADQVIIYYDGFKAAAESLATWRRVRLPVPDPGPYTVLTVPISALFDQFSGGRTDPAAMRNFLRAAFFNWSERPRFVTLLGDASYDFKDLHGLAQAGQPASPVPSYENNFDATFNLRRQFATDDWILNVDTALVIVPDFFGGRIPAPNAEGAMSYVHKMLAHERAAPTGPWRNRILLVADDEVKPGGDASGWAHLSQTATLDRFATPRHLDRRYVYLHKYPTGAGLTKPLARQDIFRYVDEGVAIFNFVGHGSAFKIADEQVFVYSDPPSLRNADRLTVFISASCDVGKFNDPALQGLGENLCMTANGGALAVISATEEAFSLQNSLLNQDIYEQVFERDTLSGDGQYHVGLAEALLAGKAGGVVNSQKYQLMGDAGVRIDLPRLWVRMTLWDSAGTAPVDSLKRGQVVTCRGEVVEGPGSTSPAVPFDGIADVLIEDSAPIEQAQGCYPGSACGFYPFYTYYAGAIFRGDVSVSAGQFETRFVVPLEATAGPRGRVRAYIEGRELAAGTPVNGVGSDSSVVSTGTTTLTDQEGPRISLAFAGGSRTVRRDAVLRVDLFDESGILTTGHTPQNGIVVTVDDNTGSRADITSSFRYAADSYQSGTASFTLPGLAPGPHTVRVSAADNLALGLAAAQHRSTAELAFEVVDTPPLNVARTYLFPNPTRSGWGGGGMFVVDAPGDSINVLIKMYTASGRLIRSLEAPGGGLGQVQISWDGVDAEGDALANGVYLYKVYVYVRQSDGTSSARQRAIAEGRFVILNP